MEQSNQTKGKRWLRPQRPMDFKSSTRCQIKMEMDTRGADLWKEIWTTKYNMPLTPEEILREQDMPRGSDIWNLSIQSRDLIDRYIFWEIRGGQIARFWDEAWQQREKMLNLQGMQEIYKTGMDRNLITVKDYWTEERGNEEWREWKPLEEWKRNATEDQKTTFGKEIDSRKIKKREGRDILRWGKETKGIFTIKEAYKVKPNNIRGRKNKSGKGYGEQNGGRRLNCLHGW